MNCKVEGQIRLFLVTLLLALEYLQISKQITCIFCNSNQLNSKHCYRSKSRSNSKQVAHIRNHYRSNSKQIVQTWFEAQSISNIFASLCFALIFSYVQLNRAALHISHDVTYVTWCDTSSCDICHLLLVSNTNHSLSQISFLPDSWGDVSDVSSVRQMSHYVMWHTWHHIMSRDVTWHHINLLIPADLRIEVWKEIKSGFIWGL